MGMQRPEYNILREGARETPFTAGSGAQNIRRGGTTAMVADAGTGMRQMLDTTIQHGGPGGRIAATEIDDRVFSASRRIANALDDTFGKPGESSSRALVVYGDKTNPLDLIYKRAYSTPIDYTSPQGRTIERLINERVPRSAIRAANELMRVEGAPRSAQILLREDGSFTRLPDVRQVDYITRGLNEVADAANGQGKLGGTTQIGRAYGNLSRDLRSNLKEAVPDYKAALNSAAGLIREGKAREFGEVVLSPRTTRSDVLDMVSGMGDAELRKVGEGLRMQIDDAIANVKAAFTDPNLDAREAAQALKILSSRASREKISSIVGDARANRLFQELDQATSAFELKAGVAENSKTAMRLMANDAIKQQTEGGVMNRLRNLEGFGGVSGAAKEVGRIAMGRSTAAKQQIEDRVYTAMAERLTGLRGEAAVRFLEALQALNQSPPLASTANAGANLASALRPVVPGAAAQVRALTQPESRDEKLARLIGSR